MPFSSGAEVVVVLLDMLSVDEEVMLLVVGAVVLDDVDELDASCRTASAALLASSATLLLAACWTDRIEGATNSVTKLVGRPAVEVDSAVCVTSTIEVAVPPPGVTVTTGTLGAVELDLTGSDVEDAPVFTACMPNGDGR